MVELKYTTETGLILSSFSRIIISSGKCMFKSGFEIFKDPDLLTTKSSSSGLNSPNKSPLPSTFNLETVSSNHIFLGFKVDNPFSLNNILFTGYFVTILPFTDLPLIARSPKSKSHLSFLIKPDCLKIIVTTSASPFGFDEKYKTLVLLCSEAKLYTLSRVTPVTLNLLM